jgi:hypothetical protein
LLNRRGIREVGENTVEKIGEKIREKTREDMREKIEEESCESKRRQLFLEYRDESIILDYSLQYLSPQYKW